MPRPGRRAGNRSHGLAGAGGARITIFISRVAPQWRPAVRVPRCPLRIPPTAPFTAREGSLTGEAEEVLQDMAAIAQVQGQLEDSEDGETDYMEVMEYLRVAPLLLFAECGKPLEPAPKPSLH